MSFGLLNDEELVKALASDPKMPKSRRVTAIPFIGKDVPSQRSEFSHPDIVIGLTVLAYRYEGLRHVDFKRLMTTLQQNMWDEVGPYHKRPSSKLFSEWVVLAGGRVRGSRLEADNVKKKKEKAHRAELKRQKVSEVETNGGPTLMDDLISPSPPPAELNGHSSLSALDDVGDETARAENGLAPTLDGAVDGSSSIDGTASADGSTSTAEGITTAEDGTTVVIDGAAPAAEAATVDAAAPVDVAAPVAAPSTPNRSPRPTPVSAPAPPTKALDGDEEDLDSQFSNIQRSHASATDIWPLRLIDFDDDEQYTIVYNLLHRLPEMIYYYLRNFIFPPTMRHQSMKLASSGQDVGGEMLCSHRVGFSGTPSNLIPIELGKLNYEKGSDGQMIYYLTSSTIMSCSIIRQAWNPQSLLLAMASANPSFSALIDTGALITGMSNYEVAHYLLTHGLPDKEGVVFLDELDRKMILVRATMSVLPLSQCGIPDTKRFAFYDQVHTTGMDIQHSVNACAVITLGKDMVFRDYAQGAFRMRGIGRGQTLRLFITPEILKLMRVHVSAAGHKRDYDAVMKRCSDDASSDVLATPAPGDLNTLLQDATAWLVVNGMMSETIQFHMLSEQNVNNVWRKKCFKNISDFYNSYEHILTHLTQHTTTRSHCDFLHPP